MALTPSTMLELGTAMPNFSLTDAVTGKTVNSNDFQDKPLLVMFICSHCPFVIHVNGELANLGQDYAGKVNIVAIGSNDVNLSPSDSPELLKAQAQEQGFSFPYLYDETQEVAKAFTAACTPDFFLFNQDQKLAYRGQLDSSRPSNAKPVTGDDLRAAMDALLAGSEPTRTQYPSVGCNIKWAA